MKALVGSVLALIAALWVAAVAAEPRPVGTTTLDLVNPATGRKVTTQVWYEAAPGTTPQVFRFHPAMRPIHVGLNAPPAAAGKRPLIVMSHGNWGTRFSQAWLAIELVNAGFIVMSPSHPGTTSDDQTVAGRFRLWDRSGDVTFALDRVLSDSTWAALVDQRRIGFFGHSFGGFTGVSLAGGRYEPARQRAFCAQAAIKDLFCSAVATEDVSAIPAHDASESYRDARVKALYITASGPGQGFTLESLKAITAPMMVDTAEFDEVLEAKANSTALAQRIPGAREVVRPVGHFVYVPVCAGRFPPSAGVISQICADPDGVDRPALHQLVVRDIVDFFGRTLPAH